MSLSRQLAATSALAWCASAAPSYAEVVDEGIKADAGEVRPPLPGEDWSGSIGAGTDFPLDYAARFSARAPSGVRGSFSMGYLPQAYVRTINNVVVSAGGYDAPTAALVEAALQSSFVLRSHIGWTPSRWIGLYGEVGYGFIALGGSIATADVLAQVVDQPVPDALVPGELREFSIDTVLHQVDLEVGWEIPIAQRLELRPALGAAMTFAASTSVEPTYRPSQSRQVETFTALGEEYLNYIFTTYVHTPVASLSLGYSF